MLLNIERRKLPMLSNLKYNQFPKKEQPPVLRTYLFCDGSLETFNMYIEPTQGVPLEYVKPDAEMKAVYGLLKGVCER